MYSAATCDALSLTNGNVIYVFNETSNQIATRAFISCNEGYYLSGPRKTTCWKSTKWDLDPPECIGK